MFNKVTIRYFYDTNRIWPSRYILKEERLWDASRVTTGELDALEFWMPSLSGKKQLLYARRLRSISIYNFGDEELASQYWDNFHSRLCQLDVCQDRDKFIDVWIWSLLHWSAPWNDNHFFFRKSNLFCFHTSMFIIFLAVDCHLPLHL